MSDQEHLKNLIADYTRRLQELERQQAIQGISVDPKIPIEIEDIKVKVKELQAKLKTPEVGASSTDTIKISTPLVPTQSSGVNLPNSQNDSTFSPPISHTTPQRSQASWILDFSKPQPILQHNSRINTILRGYDPFPSYLAEHELDTLFGQVGCFWSEHPTYARISGNFLPEVILAETGIGKTAFAYALSQIGDVNGVPLKRTLPIFMAGAKATWQNIGKQFVETLLNFVGSNSSTLITLNLEQKEILGSLLVNRLGGSWVKARLRLVLEADKQLARIIEQAPEPTRQSQAKWLQQVGQCLHSLGFERALLAIDFNRYDNQNVDYWLQNMLRWASEAIIIKLFLPDSLSENFAKLPDRIKSVTLTWNDQQLDQMAQWRFARLAGLAGIHVGLNNTLFNQDLYLQFIKYAQGNPRRLATLWQYLFNEHLDHSPNRSSFSQENLDRAIEKLSQPGHYVPRPLNLRRDDRDTEVSLQVTIQLEISIEKFTLAEREGFVHKLSQVVNINPDQIHILSVASGSMLVTLEMPERAAQQLILMYLAKDSRLEELRITKVELQQILNTQVEPKIGVITALPKEYAAVEALLDNQKAYLAPGRGAGRRYLLGEIPAANGNRHILALSLADMGNNMATAWATLMLEQFPTINSIIMVGIAGGIPYPDKPDEHVRLGDVVVSDHKGVVQYDFDKETVTETIHRHPPRPPSATLLDGVRLLKVAELTGSHPWLKYIEQASRQLRVARPSSKSDVLTDFANPQKILAHPKDLRRKRGQPRIFIGSIASANKLLKNPLKRDDLRNKFGVKAVEMEGSGIADATWHHEVGYLVVRGICDYCDANKGDAWQAYAAIVAAAYTRALLESIPA